MPREPVRPATDVMLTIFPERRGIITRPTAWQQRNTPVRFVPTIASHSSRGSWSSGARIRYPALFTSRSTRPNSRTVSATVRSTWAASRTSHDRASERRPSARTAPATASTGSSRRPLATTWAPALASSTAMARPIPWPAPVTMATRSASMPPVR
jgi:hypothetical protein